MPKFHVRSAAQVPEPSTTPRAVRERQALFEGFVREVGATSVGELELEEGENLRGVKVALRRAASRIVREVDIWDADGRVFFRSALPKRAARRAR